MDKALSFPGLMMGQDGARNPSISSGFYSLIRAIRRTSSKAEQERIVQKELDLIRQNLAQPEVSQTKMKEFLVRLIYCEMLGQSANFSYIHALKMAQQGVLLNKRVGYLAVGLFLHPQHELILLLINTIQKDLHSTNILDVCVGLTASSQLIGPEMIPAILPSIEEKLQHPQEVVRKKAVLALHSFLLKSPQLISQMTDRFQQALCDRAPGVMNAVLHIYRTLITDNPSQHRTLVRSLVSILDQVIQRKLSAEFEFRGVPAPWLQIQLLEMLAILGENNLKTSQLMYDVLEQTLDASTNVTLISSGVQYECIMTIARIHPKPALLKKAANCISLFLQASANNLKYVGLKALSAIHKVYPDCTLQHQLTVVECLEDADLTIRKATLNLLYQMCNKDNITAISEKLLDCLDVAEEDEFSKREHIHKVIELSHRFHPSLRWYVDNILKILQQGDDVVPPDTVNNVICAIQKDPLDPILCGSIIQLALSVASEKSLTEYSTQLVAWILGEHGCSERSPVPASEMLTILSRLLVRRGPLTTQTPHTKDCVLAAITKAVSRSGLVTEEARKITTGMMASKFVEVRQRASEVKMLVENGDCTELLGSSQVDAAVQTDQLDWTLSFLDEYVSEALETGAAPYKPKQQRSAEKHNSPEVMRPFLAGLNFKPYASPSTSLLTATESSDSLPPSNRDAAGITSSPQPSLSSGATGNSSEMEDVGRPVKLKTEGVKKVWSSAGYSRQAEVRRKVSPKEERMVEETEEEKQAGFQPQTQMTTVSALGSSRREPSLDQQQESEEEKRKQELAKALFGNMQMTSQVKENDKQTSEVVSRNHLDGKLQDVLFENTEGLSFADRCTEEGLVISSKLSGESHDLLQTTKPAFSGHNMLLDVADVDTGQDQLNISERLQCDLALRETISASDPSLDAAALHAPESLDLHAVKSNSSGQAEKRNKMVSLLDDDNDDNVDELGTMMKTMSPWQHDGEVPSLPAELRKAPSSNATEELVFDNSVRLTMRRVWEEDALVLVLQLASVADAEDVKITLDMPSNMTCFHNEVETATIEIGSLPAKSNVTRVAKLSCRVPAANMSLGGELTFRDAARALKRLFFQTPIHIRDLIRPKELSTEEFGKLWPEHTLDLRLVLEVKGQTMSNIMNMMRSIHLFPVEIIGNEGIICGSLLGSSTCLVHVKMEGGKLDLWVKSRSKLLSQVLAKNCARLLRGEAVR
ncbi:AP-4 complex subunit epsilon-1-like [Diadema antillarum]|uniref:AP-4 complex subunit epsilon-1-like n=1 Tax=Diadema antillarum TaxID=105358 RepID=UPI003A86F207